MGNVSGRVEYTPVPTGLKPATEEELTNVQRGDPPLLVQNHAGDTWTRFKGRGGTRDEALSALQSHAEKHGLPHIEYDETTGVLHAGTVQIEYWTKIKERLNPVFFKERNGRHMAYVYYWKEGASRPLNPLTTEKAPPA